MKLLGNSEFLDDGRRRNLDTPITLIKHNSVVTLLTIERKYFAFSNARKLITLGVLNQGFLVFALN